MSAETKTGDDSRVQEEQELRAAAREALGRDDVRLFIGYERGSFGLKIRPLIIDSVEDVPRLVWNPLCTAALTTYPLLEEQLPLPRGQKPDDRKIAMIIKGCDGRALVKSYQEKSCSRDQLYLIGVACRGMVDSAKLKRACNEKGIDLDRYRPEDVSVRIDEAMVVVTTGSEELRLDLGSLMPEKCTICLKPAPDAEAVDVLIGTPQPPRDPSSEDYRKALAEYYGAVDKLEALSLEERWEFWQEVFSKCIRCYACRNVCPLCSCRDCILERLEPIWVRRAVTTEANMTFHMIRSFHQLGRCIGCGECERVCPMGLPLRALGKKFERDVKEIFGYEPGTSTEEPSFFAQYRPDEEGEFIW